MTEREQAPAAWARMCPSEFVTRNTRLRTVPLLPEIQLHVADEMFPLWQLTEEQLTNSGLPPPFWAFAWAGGQALARYILDTPAVVVGKRVLDFAAGSGLVGIAAAQAGAAHVTCTDVDEIAVAACALNAAHNQAAIETSTEDWIGYPLNDFDVVLAGDIFYERSMADNVEVWLRKERGMGSDVLIGDPGRSYLPKEGLSEVARYCVTTSRELEDSEFRKTMVWRLAP